MQVIQQYRVDAPAEWVHAFLLKGTREEDVTVTDDVVEIRQHDPLMHLVVRNTVRAEEGGGTILDVDARLRLRGIALVVGTVFSRRLRRTLVRSLDGLPVAIEKALRDEDAGHNAADEVPPAST